MDIGIVDGGVLGIMGRGLAIGLVLAVPVGPIGMLCIVRTLRFGRLAGLATGLGAATADATYAAFAAFGLATLTATLVSLQTPLTIGGGVALALIGVRTIRSPVAPPPTAGSMEASPGLRAETPSFRTLYAGTVALTLANPATILTFVGIVAGITSGDARSPLATAALATAVFLGSSLWWLLLSATMGAVRRRWLAGGDAGLEGRRMRVLNVISGGVLIAFGVLALARAVM